jgi:hypothetical protein
MIFLALQRQDKKKYRRLFMEAMAAAQVAAENDPDLAESIKQTILVHMVRAALQKRASNRDTF